MKRIAILSLGICLMNLKNGFAQETLQMKDPNIHYKKGMELVDEGQPLAARREFELFVLEKKPPLTQQEYLRISNAKYYIGAAAVDLDQPDAEKILKDYLQDFHETSLRRLAYFQLGRLSQKHGNYKESIQWFEKVTRADLSNEQRMEYNFKLAYAYFVMNDFDKAKPLFKEVKSFENKYYNDANYYYGYIEFSEGKYDAALKSFTIIKDLDQYKSVVPYYITQIYFMKQEYDKVIQYAGSLVKDKNLKYYDEMMHILGQSYFYTKDYENAEKFIKAYVSKTPKVKKEDIYQLAYSQYKMAKFNDAINNFKQLYIIDDTLGQNAMYALADCYLKTGRKAEARTAFAQSARTDFDAVIKENSLANYIKLSYELDENTETVNSASNFLNDFPSSGYIKEITEILTNALLKTKNYKEAIRVIESTGMKNALLNKAFQQVTYYRSVQEFNDGHLDESMKLLNKSLSYPIDKDIQADALFMKGEIYYENAEYDKSIIEYGKYLQIANLEKLEKTFSNPFKAYYAQGYAYLKMKKYANAVQPLRNAITAYSGSGKSAISKEMFYDAVLRLADATYMTKDLDNAMSSYQKVIDESQKNVDYSMFQKGMIQGFKNNDNAKVNTMQLLVTRYPSSAYADAALYEKGVTYQQDLNEPNSALSALQNLVNSYPSSNYKAPALLRLGLINYNLGNNTKALDYYKTVVKEYPKTEEMKEALSIMQEIYVGMGKPDEYIAYLNQNGIDASATAQDSIYYKAAEERYLEGDYTNAVTAFESYLSKFTEGFFAIDAHYFAADCQIRTAKHAQALSHLDVVIAKAPNSYYERALKKAAAMAFENMKDYDKAHRYYVSLYEIFKSRPEAYGMLINALRSSYLAKADDDVIRFADLTISNEKASKDELLEAHYYKGTVLLERNDLDAAQNEFRIVGAGEASEQAAESNYNLALILSKKGKAQESLDEAFRLKDKIEGYDYWLAKLFILIGDDYRAVGDNYQAKATYESILEHYKGDQKLLDECKVKLDAMKEETLKKSIIDMSIPQKDSILKLDENK